jgi:thiamine-monophosphate kinase
LTRDRVSAGDELFVTGVLGGPGAALDAFLRGESAPGNHRARFAAPRPRIAEARWLAERGARAAIDISDGLVADAGHLASASGVRIELELASLPLVDDVRAEDAAKSGEEYELLVAFAREAPPDVDAFHKSFGVKLTRVGRASAGRDVAAIGAAGRVDLPRGHDHLS